MDTHSWLADLPGQRHGPLGRYVKGIGRAADIHPLAIKAHAGPRDRDAYIRDLERASAESPDGWLNVSAMSTAHFRALADSERRIDLECSWGIVRGFKVESARGVDAPGQLQHPPIVDVSVILSGPDDEQLFLHRSNLARIRLLPRESAVKPKPKAQEPLRPSLYKRRAMDAGFDDEPSPAVKRTIKAAQNFDTYVITMKSGQKFRANAPDASTARGLVKARGPRRGSGIKSVAKAKGKVDTRIPDITPELWKTRKKAGASVKKKRKSGFDRSNAYFMNYNRGAAGNFAAAEPSTGTIEGKGGGDQEWRTKLSATRAR